MATKKNHNSYTCCNNSSLNKSKKSIINPNNINYFDKMNITKKIKIQ